MLYFDHAASTPLTDKALSVLIGSYEDDWANPSAAHKMGKELNKKIESAREEFLTVLQANKDYKFVFTSSATESNATIFNFLNERSGAVLCSSGDHPSITEPFKESKYIEIPLNDQGEILRDELLNLINDQEKLLILSSVNNHSGSLHPIIKIAEEVKIKNPFIHIHVDDSQGFSKIPLTLESGIIDSLTISAQKMGGPKGIAGLYIKKGIPLIPLLKGGGHQDGLRSSTLPTPLILSFQQAMQERIKYMDKSLKKITALNEQARDLLLHSIDGIQFPFPTNCTSPYILTLILPKISADIVLRHLEREDIYISTSAACSSHKKGVSPTFAALKINEQFHKNIIRISFHPRQTESDIQELCKKLSEYYKEIESLTL